jgi:ketopantoate hydroxymethyltransferase
VCLDIKELLKDAHGVLGTGNRMANGSGISVNLVIVAALESLVTKEVNVLVGNAIGLLGLVLEVLEAVGLVPASREHVEGNLSANGKGEAEMTKSLLEDSDKLLTDLGILVVLLEVVSFLCASVTADGADVNHAVAELDKGSALDGNVEISDVVEDKVGELLVLLFTNEFDEGV